MHNVRARANGNQPRQRTVVDEARIVLADEKRHQRAADHRHERIDRNQAADFVDGLRAHHIKTEPAHRENPRAQRQKWNRRRRVRRNLPLFAVTAGARPQQQHRDQANPTADGVHNDRTREVMKLFAERCFEPRLNAEALVPCDALKQRVHERHEKHRRHQLRTKLRALGDPARHNRRDRGGEGQQEEELHELVAVFRSQRVRGAEKVSAVGDPVTDDEIRHR